MKKVLVYALLLFAFPMIILTGCTKNNIIKIDNFKNFHNEINNDKPNNHNQAFLSRNQIFYFKNLNQYLEFINDKNIFIPQLSDDFNKFNLNYNEDYFKKYDLILCQIGVSGSHTKVYYSITSNSETNELNLKIKKKNKHNIDDQGMYYEMNYLTVQKHENAKKIKVSIIGAKQESNLEYEIK